MGFFDDFSDIVDEFKGLKKEVVGEFTGLKREVESSVGDIKSGVTGTVDDAKSKLRQSVSLDGLTKGAKSTPPDPPRKTTILVNDEAQKELGSDV